jgi:hypothetical protein
VVEYHRLAPDPPEAKVQRDLRYQGLIWSPKVSRECLKADTTGWLFTAFSCACLFVAVQVMFEYRAEEGRRGIYRRC